MDVEVVTISFLVKRERQISQTWNQTRHVVCHLSCVKLCMWKGGREKRKRKNLCLQLKRLVKPNTIKTRSLPNVIAALEKIYTICYRIHTIVKITTNQLWTQQTMPRTTCKCQTKWRERNRTCQIWALYITKHIPTEPNSHE